MSSRIGSPFSPDNSIPVNQGLSSQTTVQSFTNPEPIFSLPKPEQGTSFRGSLIITQDSISITDTYSHKENVETLVRVENVSQKMINFAKQHPFLTLGFLVGLVFIISAFPTLSASFASKFGITIGHAKLTIGGVGGVMALYYGLSLINLARKTAVKDDLEASIDNQQRAAQSILQGSYQDVKNTLSDAGKEAREISNEAKGSIQKQKESTQKEVESSIKEAHALSVRLEKEKNRISRYITQNILNPELVEKGNALLAQIESEIQNAPSILDKKLLNEPSFDLPIFAPDLNLIDPPQNHEANVEKLKSMTEKFLELGEAIVEKVKENIPSGTDTKHFVLQHPFSSLVMLSGLLITLCAIPVIYYMIQGKTSLIGLGSISLGAIANIVIYGICLIYGGYNSAYIERLKEKLKSMQAEVDEKIKRYEEEKKHVLNFQKSISDLLKDFGKKWKEVEDNELTFSSEERQHYVEPIRRRTEILEACADFHDAIIQHLAPSQQSTKPLVENQIRQGFDGAEAVGKAHQAI